MAAPQQKESRKTLALGTFLHLKAPHYLFAKMGPCQASILSSQTS